MSSETPKVKQYINFVKSTTIVYTLKFNIIFDICYICDTFRVKELSGGQCGI